MSYQVSDLVLVNSHVLSNTKAGITSKFVPRRDGPYSISRIVSPTSYEVVDPKSSNVPLGTYHVSALTRYVQPEGEVSVPAPVHPLRRRGRPRRNLPPEDGFGPRSPSPENAQPSARESVRPSARENEPPSVRECTPFETVSRRSSRVRRPKVITDL